MDKTVKMDCQVHQDRLDLQALRGQRDLRVNLYRLFHLPEQVVIAQMVELNLLLAMAQQHMHVMEQMGLAAEAAADQLVTVLVK
jgi:hypothetical protein